MREGVEVLEGGVGVSTRKDKEGGAEVYRRKEGGAIVSTVKETEVRNGQQTGGRLRREEGIKVQEALEESGRSRVSECPVFRY